MTNQFSLQGILFRPKFMICIFGLIAAGIGCTGADKPLSSDLTDQVLEKPDSYNSTAGRATSFSVQISPEETDSGVQKRQEAKGDKRQRRRRKNDGVDWRAAMATAPDEWSDELKSQIAAAGYDLNKVTENIQKQQEAQGDKRGKSPKRKRKNDGVDWRAAMATAPDEWSDELKSQIAAAGYDLNKVAEKIQKRQNAKDAKGPVIDG
jgi:hypothetical protein